MRYQICSYCGANLDFGEKCDCEDENIRKEMGIEKYIKSNFSLTQTGQMRIGESENGKF